MASKKNPKSKENQARKPVSQKAMSDTSGSNLADFKNKAVDAAKVVASRVAVGPVQLLLDNKQVKNLAAESSGINDVKRFSKDKSVTNAGFVALNAAAYAAPAIKALRATSTALRAGELGAITVMSQRASAEAAARAGQLFTKTMKLKDRTGVLNSVRGTATPLYGRSVSTTGTKSIRAVEAATQRMMKEAAAADQALSRANSAGTVKGMLMGSSAVVAENILTSKMKNEQARKKK